MQLAVKLAHLVLLVALGVIAVRGDDLSLLLVYFWGSCEFLSWSIDLAYRKVGALVHGQLFMEV